jgi:hypothetical protein
MAGSLCSQLPNDAMVENTKKYFGTIFEVLLRYVHTQVCMYIYFQNW